jgi:hypothetical protein
MRCGQRQRAASPRVRVWSDQLVPPPVCQTWAPLEPAGSVVPVGVGTGCPDGQSSLSTVW